MPAPSVLQVVLSLDPGGTERLVVELVRRLRDTMPMAVCCLDRPGAWGKKLAGEGVLVGTLDRRPGFRPGLARALRSVARQAGARVVHCHQYSPFVYAALARLSAPDLRVVFTEHGRLSDLPASGKRRVVNPLLSRLGHRLFAVSHDLKAHMATEGLPASRIEVIHNGIELDPPAFGAGRAERRRTLGIADATCLVVTLARLDPVKDLGTLVDAIAAGRASGVDLALAIVGDGPERSTLERHAETAGVGEWVHFLGHRENARAWLKAGDVFANSSISEGVSLTILEAMAASLPVVATRVGGTPEVVDETCGRLVPSRNAAALASAIGELARDASLRNRLGAEGRAVVETRFTLDRMVAAYAKVYEEVA